MIPQIDATALQAWRHDAGREPPLIVDVRERWEFDYCRIDDSLSVPLGTLAQAVATLPRDRDLVLVCHKGGRSLAAATWLMRAGFERVHNLSGGVAAWAATVDPSMKRY